MMMSLAILQSENEQQKTKRMCWDNIFTITTPYNIRLNYDLAIVITHPTLDVWELNHSFHQLMDIC